MATRKTDDDYTDRKKKMTGTGSEGGRRLAPGDELESKHDGGVIVVMKIDSDGAVHVSRKDGTGDSVTSFRYLARTHRPHERG